jgi:putative phosphoesterase
MKIGIISDTHDDIENVQEAIDIFNKEGVEYVIHAGDYIFPGVTKEFQNLKSTLIGVLGNNDGERVEILKDFLKINGQLKGELGELEIDGIRFGIYHGTDKDVKQSLIDSRRYDVLVCGHTHKREPVSSGTIQDNQKTFVLNPGSAHRKNISISGFFNEVGRIIIFDTSNRYYKFVDLSK